MPEYDLEHLDTRSQSPVDDRIAGLRALFPEVFREEKIDFDALQRSLGEWVDPGKERFGLTWPGKAECMRVIQQPSVGTLRPDWEGSVEFETTQNLIIEGDNLEVLKLLQKSYHGKIKLIYIDPPYNTGNDFVYPDDYRSSLKNYLKMSGQLNEDGTISSTNPESSGRYHSNWLNMIFPRLYLARNLLRDDGAIFVSIDEHEIENLKLLMSEIYGAENFVACVANVNNPKGRSDAKHFATAHELLLVYKRGELRTRGLTPGDHIIRRYNKTNTDGRTYREIDLRKTGDNSRREDRPNLFYYFHFDPKTETLLPSHESAAPPGWLSIKPRREDGEDGNWRWGMATATERIGDLTAKLMPVRQYWSVFEKDWLTADERVKPTTAFTSPEFNSERGSEELARLGLPKELFPNPKPLGLLQLIVELMLEPSDNEIVLDFFAGSGTTAHAVAKLNADDGGNRKYILVQFPERLDKPKELADGTAMETIADICRERVRRAGKQIAAGDSGFRSYKLAESNFTPWQGDSGDIPSVSRQVELFTENVIPDRSPEDLLTEILLKSGYELTTPVEWLTLAGKSVASVAEGALLVCLDASISLDAIEAMAARDPGQIVCLETGFEGDDGRKVNALQLIRSRARGAETTIAFKVV